MGASVRLLLPITFLATLGQISKMDILLQCYRSFHAGLPGSGDWLSDGDGPG